LVPQFLRNDAKLLGCAPVNFGSHTLRFSADAIRFAVCSLLVRGPAPCFRVLSLCLGIDSGFARLDG
jgi:hypothetical protein